MRVCFIVATQNQNTILDRIAHEIGKEFTDPIYFYQMDDKPETNHVELPKADHYFVSHYSMLIKVMSKVNPGLTPVTCFFTHDKGGLPMFVDAFNLCHCVIAESPEGEELLRNIGVRSDIVHFVPEGGDNEMFKPHQRTNDGAILVCGTNYADGRKNPELIKQVKELLPNRQFVFCGSNWMGTIIDNTSNQTFEVDKSYSYYPSIYSKCSIYLSCSKLEGGGPNSLIEAMHANLVPVVSDTGNARQYIQHGYNGFIFPIGATPEHVASLIERAYSFRPQDQFPFNDIWKTVEGFNWKSYGIQMKEIITNDYSNTLSQGDYAFKPIV